MSALLPCPFCGSDSARVRINVVVECRQCGSMVVNADAVNAWNTRYFSGGKNLSNDSFASIDASAHRRGDAVLLSVVKPRRKQV